MPKEIERRFLVHRLGAVPPVLKKVEIEQGYFEIPSSWKSLRVRITDQKKAEMTGKIGSGLEREEIAYPLNLKLGQMLLEEFCSHRLKKRRHYVQGGWEVDFFKEPLKGLIIVEKEWPGLPPSDFKPPAWLEGLEVTDSLTNLHLARLATDLHGAKRESAAQILQRELAPIPTIALVGPPCSGKSSIMTALKKEFPALHFVPEVATIVINEVGIKPQPDQLSGRRFQQLVYRVQTIFENTSREFALGSGKKALLLDRGSLDGVAYLRGGMKEFEELLHANRDQEYRRYGLVIYLDLPPKKIYREKQANNPARRENYRQAQALDYRLKTTWGKHHNFVEIPWTEDWEEKLEQARREIERFIIGKEVGKH